MRFARHDVLANKNMIAVHRRRSGIVRNSDRLIFWIIRLESADPLTVHSNSAGNQVRIQRKSVAIALLDARDPARAFQAGQDALQLAFLIPWQPELR
jgi:hypothetical protein